MTRAERDYARRQYNYNRVPNPLVEGLVFAWVAGVDEAALADRIRELQTENERVRKLDEN